MIKPVVKKELHQVIVETAYPLNKGQIDRLKDKIESILQTSSYSFEIKEKKDLLNGIVLTIDSVVIDASLKGQLQELKKEINKHNVNELDAKKIAHLFQKKIDEFTPYPILKEIGTVLSVTDGIAHVQGLTNIEMGERVIFESGSKGLVLNLNTDSIDIVILDNFENVKENQHVYRTKQPNTVPVGMELLGRVVNALGEPIDGKEALKTKETRPLNISAPSIISRSPVNKPIQTGIKGIDALVPIGKGQRELIIGDRQTGKTSLIIDMILSQKSINEKAKTPKEQVFCVYVAIGQKQSSVRDLVQVLKNKGALDYSVIVCANASDSAGLQYLAPYAGCSIAEFFRDKGLNAIVFYDDLSKHAVAYREISLLLKRPPGREAYPGDIFYIHSRLLERAAQLDEKNGGGSLTAIPVIETQEGDVSAYIPTNVISITDGQIFLETELFNQGIRPAINVGLSVSRVGSSAQTKAMKKVAGSLKLDLAQYREVLSFSQFSSDLDTSTQNLLNRGARLTNLLKQKPFQPLTMAQEVVALYSGVRGFLDKISINDVERFETNLQEHITVVGAIIIEKITFTQDLTPELDTELKLFLENFTKDFIENNYHDELKTN